MTTGNLSNRWWGMALLSLLVAAALPGIGRMLRVLPAQRCALDGAEVDPQTRVLLTTADQTRRSFCSLFCAERWLAASGARPQSVLVVDETTGTAIPSEQAYFVRSLIIAHEPTGERRHAFRNPQDARRHAEEHRGRILEGDDRPFGL